MVKHVVYIDGAEERLRSLCEAAIKDMFQGDESMTERVKNRLEKEMESVTKNGFATIYLHHYELIHEKLRYSRKNDRGMPKNEVPTVQSLCCGRRTNTSKIVVLQNELPKGI